MLENVTLPLVIATALIDSINPCAIGVLVVLLAVLLDNTKNKSKMILISIIYISTVFIVYVLAGLGLIWFQAKLISQGFAEYLGIVVGVVVIIMGLIEIKDFFWYGKGISLHIPKKHAKKIRKMMEEISVLSAILLGAFVAVVELPCTGGPYLAITALLAEKFDLLALTYLLIYNLIFVFPLIVICTLVYFGVSTDFLRSWKDRKKKWMRLAAGIILLILGVFLIYYYAIGGL